MLCILICKKYFQEFKIGKFKLRVGTTCTLSSQYEVVTRSTSLHFGAPFTFTL
jgi:hypothetical protein